MEDQSLDTSNALAIREGWQEKFYLQLIGSDNPIKITEEQKNGIVHLLEQGKKFMTLGKYIIMLNSIRVISPRYEPNNIPPRPPDEWDYTSEMEKINRAEKIQNEWDNLFGLIKNE